MLDNGFDLESYHLNLLLNVVSWCDLNSDFLY